ncbi:M16 family metallopeptidase [Clostridium paraputrificum]|uniref:M16 family metallopeptidase n=1 Tax=Clostridium TaxID=1485 RepID=UPI003D35002C
MYNLYTLKNGLRVVTERNEGVNSVSVGVMIQNGSRNETSDINGISHFIEHMFFKGTEKRSSKEIAETIENVGGQLNAFTSKEATCYYIKNLYTHLDLSLDVLSDMILNSKFDPEEIEREKGVVVEEINMSEDSPEDVLEDIHSKACFEENPLAYPILGTIDKVKSLNREKIKKFIGEKYTPYNSVISVCGKFDEKELTDLIEKYFGEWKSEKIYVPTYEETFVHSDTYYTNKEIEQLHVSLGLKGLPFGHEKGYALVLLSNIFGGGASSILFQKVREELGLCYNIYCYPQPYQGTGVLNIYTGLGKTYGEKALTVIVDELNKFSKEGITNELLEINKEKIKANYILGLESTSSKMFSNAKSVLFKNKVSTEEEVIKKIDRISSDDIDFVLKECFAGGILNSAYVGQGVECEELNNILFNTTKAYNNKSVDSKIKV